MESSRQALLWKAGTGLVEQGSSQKSQRVFVQIELGLFQRLQKRGHRWSRGQEGFGRFRIQMSGIQLKFGVYVYVVLKQSKWFNNGCKMMQIVQKANAKVMRHQWGEPQSLVVSLLIIDGWGLPAWIQ